MLVVLSRGHHGSGTNAPAAFAGFREDLVARDYMAATEDRLLELGHQVVVMSGNPYQARWARAKALRADVYVCNHTNSGYDPADADPYGLVLHDERSQLGNMLAGRVGHAMLQALPELSRVAIVAAHERDWTKGPWNTIRGVYSGTPVGLCYEPGFIDAIEHASLWQADGPHRVGAALAEGIDAYWRNR